MGFKTAVRRMFGGEVEERATFRNPGSLFDSFGSNKTAANVKVTPAAALGWSAYFACIRNIAEDVGKLPRGVFEPTPDGGRRERRDHPYWRLLQVAPNPDMSAMTFFETMTAHALSLKGGFAEIVRNGRGQATALWPIDPNDVTIETLSGGGVIYRVCGEQMPSEDIIHVHGLGYEGVTGYAMHYLSRESIARSLAAQEHNGSMLGNGAMVPGVIEVPKMLSDDAMKHLQASWSARRNGASNNGKPLLLENDAKYKAMGLDAEKSQLMESISAGVVDTARWFRMPPHKIQHLENATFSNIEQQNIQYVVDCLTSWLTRWEQEIARKLFTGSDSRLYLRHNVNGLLRGDMAGRATFYKELFALGAMNTNDIRRSEDMTPIGGDGDARYVPSNLMLLGSQGPTVQKDDSESARHIADAFVPVAVKAHGDLIRVATDKANRAEKRGKLDDWAADYFADTDHTRATLGVVAEAFAESLAASRGVPRETYNAEVMNWMATESARYAEDKRSTVAGRVGWSAEADAVHMMDGLCTLLKEVNDED